MIVTTVARKPVNGTVAANVLNYGTGGLNIDAVRVRGTDVVPMVQSDPSNRIGTVGTDLGITRADKVKFREAQRSSVERANTLGRWPGNLILLHHSKCKPNGITRVAGAGHDKGDRGTGGFWSGRSNKPCGPQYGDPDGTEVVASWRCVLGCPAIALDGQSGIQKSGVAIQRNGGGQFYGTITYAGPGPGSGSTPKRVDVGYEDTGGASRYYKQVKATMSELPSDLIEYLTTLITPPDGPPALFWPVIPPDLSEFKDNSVNGLIAQGKPTPAQAAELMRVLMPGAHLLLVALPDQPTGHTGACRIEDAGFEIRDAILLADEARGLHYVPKASRSEREAGCANLQDRDSRWTVERDPESAGAKNPRAGAGRQAGASAHRCKNCKAVLRDDWSGQVCKATGGEHEAEETGKQPLVHNAHPTVKPANLMARLLADVPRDQGPILEPFMGSGSTLIACVRTGHDAVGIEREADYVDLADARVRHADRERIGGCAVIESEHSAPKPKEESLDDHFGWSDND